MSANAEKRGVIQDQTPILVRTPLVPTVADVIGDGATPNIISMNGNDTLILYIAAKFVAMTKLVVSLEFSATGDNGTATDWYQDSMTEEAALAAGVIESKVGSREYTFTVSGQYKLTIPVDDRAVRVAVRAVVPGAGDLVGITALRRIRDSLVGS